MQQYMGFNLHALQTPVVKHTSLLSAHTIETQAFDISPSPFLSTRATYSNDRAVDAEQKTSYNLHSWQ